MDLTLLFFLPLIGGFLFVENFVLTRFRAARQETQRLYYKAAMWGVTLSIVGLLVHYLLGRHLAAYRSFAEYLRLAFIGPLFDRPTTPGAAAYSADAVQARVDVAFACVWALLLGAATPILNGSLRVVDRLDDLCFARRARRPSLLENVNLRSITDQFEMLLATALRHDTKVQVTLSNQKVYVGTITKTLEPRSQEKYFRLLPFMSGFRSKDTGQIVYNTFYTDLFEAPLPGDPSVYEVVVPMDKVVSASGFDLDIHYAFQQSQDPIPEVPVTRNETVLAGGLTVRLERSVRPPAGASRPQVEAR